MSECISAVSEYCCYLTEEEEQRDHNVLIWMQLVYALHLLFLFVQAYQMVIKWICQWMQADLKKIWIRKEKPISLFTSMSASVHEGNKYNFT